MATLDDYSKYSQCHPIQNKEASTTAEALIDDARAGGGFASRNRTDNGSEWRREFGNELRRRIIPAGRGLPCRSTTDACQERFHGIMNNGVRACLQKSCPPCEFWGKAAQHFCHNHNRVNLVGSTGKTAFELRHEKE